MLEGRPGCGLAGTGDKELFPVSQRVRPHFVRGCFSSGTGHVFLSFFLFIYFFFHPYLAGFI